MATEITKGGGSSGFVGAAEAPHASGRMLADGDATGHERVLRYLSGKVGSDVSHPRSNRDRGVNGVMGFLQQHDSSAEIQAEDGCKSALKFLSST